MPTQQKKKRQTVARTIMISIHDIDDLKTLAALAAFNSLDVHTCAERILSDNLKSLREEMNFHGQMIV